MHDSFRRMWHHVFIGHLVSGMAQKYSQHGSFATRVEGRLIISDVNGPWNVELVRSWGREAHALAVGLSGPHVGIAVLHGSVMCPPDAFALMREMIAYAIAHLDLIGNCVAADATVEGASLLEPLYANFYDPGTPHRFFSDLDECKSWAAQLLAAKGY